MEIALRTRAPDDAEAANEVRAVLDSALRREAALAAARRDYFASSCSAFEERIKLSSEEFMRQFEAGTLGDDAEFFDWYAAKRGLDVWERRYRIVYGE